MRRSWDSVDQRIEPGSGRHAGEEWQGRRSTAIFARRMIRIFPGTDRGRFSGLSLTSLIGISRQRSRARVPEPGIALIEPATHSTAGFLVLYAPGSMD